MLKGRWALVLVLALGCADRSTSPAPNASTSGSEPEDEGVLHLTLRPGKVSLGERSFTMRPQDRIQRLDELFDLAKKLRAEAADGGGKPRFRLEPSPDTNGYTILSTVGTLGFAGIEAGEIKTLTRVVPVDFYIFCAPDGLRERLVLQVDVRPPELVLAWVDGWGSETGHPFVPVACRPFGVECVREVERISLGSDVPVLAGVLSSRLEKKVGGVIAEAAIVQMTVDTPFGSVVTVLDALVEGGAKRVIVDATARGERKQPSEPDCEIEPPDEKARRVSGACFEPCRKETRPKIAEKCSDECKASCERACGSRACREACGRIADM